MCGGWDIRRSLVLLTSGRREMCRYIRLSPTEDGKVKHKTTLLGSCALAVLKRAVPPAGPIGSGASEEPQIGTDRRHGVMLSRLDPRTKAVRQPRVWRGSVAGLQGRKANGHLERRYPVGVGPITALWPPIPRDLSRSPLPQTHEHHVFGELPHC
jgi:hypothetical protein